MSIEYAFETTPARGELADLRDGLRWLRMPLPFELEHINLWLLDDAEKYTIVDAGVFTNVSRKVWEHVFAGPMKGKALERVVVTHLHPDHVGCAGWLTDKHDVELWMTREEYLLCRILVADTGRPVPAAGVRFYKAAGFDEQALARYEEMFGMFGRVVATLPDAYRRLVDGDTLVVNGNSWQVVVGRGHSPEHACLYDPERNLLISGDQVLPTISSNVSVYPTEPHADPLRDWLDSLKELQRRLPPDVLVLPAHGRPFRGVHERLEALTKEHMTGLARLLELCAEPRRAIDVFPALFKGRISQGNLIMATGESIAHLNYLVEEGAVIAETDGGVTWYRSV